jgi:pyruvate formate lyase activating enzyme
MREAMLYTKETDQLVICYLCAHRCTIAKGKMGICAVRQNQDGILYALVADQIVAEHVDPIEKKPFYHVLPGSLSYSIATVGCNFHCANCQNSDISQFPRAHPGQFPGQPTTPEEIVAAALRSQCASIAYTYTEPTIYFELAYETARLASAHGLKNFFVTNGYLTPEALDVIQPYLDGANVDLKGFDDDRYRKLCGARVEPVKDTIRAMRARNIWVEVTTLLIPGHNDTEAELQQIAAWLYSIDPAMPWHVSAFYPRYRLLDVHPTPPASIRRAVEIGKAAGLHYVYSGNIHGDDDEHTWCHQCGQCLIQRTGFSIVENRVTNSKCPSCGTILPGIF